MLKIALQHQLGKIRKRAEIPGRPHDLKTGADIVDRRGYRREIRREVKIVD